MPEKLRACPTSSSLLCPLVSNNRETFCLVPTRDGEIEGHLGPHLGPHLSRLCQAGPCAELAEGRQAYGERGRMEDPWKTWWRRGRNPETIKKALKKTRQASSLWEAEEGVTSHKMSHILVRQEDRGGQEGAAGINPHTGGWKGQKGDFHFFVKVGGRGRGGRRPLLKTALPKGEPPHPP